jgi:hypothetical protein
MLLLRQMNDPVVSSGVSTNDNIYLNAASGGKLKPDDFATFIVSGNPMTP